MAKVAWQGLLGRGRLQHLQSPSFETLFISSRVTLEYTPLVKSRLLLYLSNVSCSQVPVCTCARLCDTQRAAFMVSGPEQRSQVLGYDDGTTGSNIFLLKKCAVSVPLSWTGNMSRRFQFAVFVFFFAVGILWCMQLSAFGQLGPDCFGRLTLGQNFFDWSNCQENHELLSHLPLRHDA